MAKSKQVDPAVSKAMRLLNRARWAGVPAKQRSEAARRAGLGNANRDPEEMSRTNRRNARKLTPEALERRNAAIREALAKRKAALEAEEAAKEKARAARRRKRARARKLAAGAK